MLDFQLILKDRKNLLLTGDTGTGKTHFVRDLHARYLADQPFVVINLAALASSVFESELFGHKKGAFTGATEDRVGFVQQAGQGILFFDEVGELSLALQAKLLHLIEDRCYFPVGSRHALTTKARFIFATNRDLLTEVREGRFREDLYYRLSGLTYSLAPLRDLPELKRAFLQEIRGRLTAPAYEYLLHEYDWPGNIREWLQLKDKITYSKKRMGERFDLTELGVISRRSFGRGSTRCTGYYGALESFEREFFEQKMNEFAGRVNYASEQLGLSKSTLIAKLKKYDINTLKIKAMSQSALAA